MLNSLDWGSLPNDVRDGYKRQALDEGLCSQIAALHKQAYFDGDESAKEAWISLQNDPVWRAARALNQARYGRVTRLRKRIEDMVFSGDAWFLTLTFTDDVLESTTEETRRKYVRRYLKERTDFYVANIDFGDHHTYLDSSGQLKNATGREHYHALVIGAMPTEKDENGKVSPDWKLGYSKQVHVRVSSESVTALPIYIAKLTNHALKESVRNTRYIYSKKVFTGYTDLEICLKGFASYALHPSV